MSNTSFEMATTTTQFQITYSGKSLQVTLPHQASVLDLVHIILRNFDLSQDTIKLILPPKRGGLIRLRDHIDARIVDIGEAGQACAGWAVQGTNVVGCTHRDLTSVRNRPQV